MTPKTMTAMPAKTGPQNVKAPMPAAAGFALIDTCRFKIRTTRQARELARFAAQVYADPVQAETGLYELMTNAIEHGCLGIGHDLKTKLLENGTWDREVARRESLPENRQKEVDVVLARKEGGIYAVITDPGQGFDWKAWISIDPARAGMPHGRGIARARGVSFDSIAYNTPGNQVAVFVRDTPALNW
jgi:anti-sigma regulatory factor (Ser/Thr protein kinase)